jgi:hypothetical protein
VGQPVSGLPSLLGFLASWRSRYSVRSIHPAGSSDTGACRSGLGRIQVPQHNTRNAE